jgi:hypothetical protein|tara:strand:- start:3826 stop:4020 length:195 start_codon:yes stop_codon:yes gene_type:complete
MKVGDLIKFNETAIAIHNDHAIGFIAGDVYTDSDGDKMIPVYWTDINKRFDEMVEELEVISEGR